MAEIQGVPHMCRSAVFAETNHRIPRRRDNGANQSSQNIDIHSKTIESMKMGQPSV